MNKKNIVGFGLIAGIASGCATVPRDAGFQDVQTAVSERVGQRVQWRTGGPEDQEVAGRVRETLKQELDAEQAVQIALLNNPQLQTTYEELGISQAALVQAGLIRNPVFGAAVLFPSGGGRANLDFSIAQDFLSVFYLPLNRRFAAAEFEAVKLRVTTAVIALAHEVRSTFYRTQAARQMQELFEEVVLNTSASYVAAKRLFEAGNITELALYQEQALYQESRLALAAAEAEYVLQRERLNSLMGLWGNDTQWSMSPRLPQVPEAMLDPEGLERKAIDASLGLAAQRKLIEAAGFRLGFVNATWLIPDLEIGFQAEREEDWERGPSLSVQIPIFDAGQARRAAARAELRRAQAEYAALAVELRAAVRAGFAGISSARDRALFVKDVLLPLKSRLVEHTLLQYNAMQVGVFQLLTAQREQIAAARQYIETLRDYWLLLSNLQQTLSGGVGVIPTEIMTPQPGTVQPDMTEPGGTQPGGMQPSGPQPGGDRPGAARPGAPQPGGAQPGINQPAKAH